MVTENKAFKAPCQKCRQWICGCEPKATDASELEKEVIRGFVAKCLLDAGLPTSAQIAAQIEASLSALDLINAEQIKAIALECQRSEEAITVLIQGQLIAAGIPSADTIGALAKPVAAACFSDLIKDYCTKSEINELVKFYFHDECAIREFAKSEAEKCIAAYPFAQLVNDALAASGFQNADQVEAIAKDQATACIAELPPHPTQLLIEAWAKAVALQCYNEQTEGDYNPTQAELEALIKVTALDCFKGLIEELVQVDPTPPDGNTRVSGLGVTCDATGLVRFQLLQSDNTVEQAEVDLSKFLPGATNTITGFSGTCTANGLATFQLSQSNGPTFTLPLNLSKFLPGDDVPAVSVCYSYGGPTFTADASGKIEIRDQLKVQRFGGGVDVVAYQPADDCRVIPYTGPSQTDIESIAQDIYDNLSGGGTVLTINDVKDCIQAVSNTLCITSFTTALNTETGELSIQVADQCGSRSDSVFIPTAPAGTNGITQEQAKLIALNCINDNVKAIVLQCIADEVSVPTDADITQIVANYWTANQSQFCNTSVGVDFNEISRELTLTVTDQCGAKSDSATIPAGAIGGGITAAQSKTIAQGCIDDPANDDRFCNASVQTSLVGTNLQTSVTDACGTLSDITDLASLQTSYCLNGVQLGLVGSTLSLSVTQANCPIQSDTINLPFDSTGNPVECCNTNFSPTAFDPDTCIVTGQLNQSAGDPVTISIPMADFFSDEIVLGDDGCTEYNVLRLGNKEIFRANAPVDKKCCIKFCVTYTEVTDETITVNTPSGFDWMWTGDATGQQGSPSADSLAATFQPGDYIFTVCQRDACEDGEYPTFSSGLPTSKHDCCC